MIVPPVIWLLGHRLSREVKCVTMGNRLSAVPISQMIVCARSRLRLHGGEVNAGDTAQVLVDLDGRVFRQILAVGATLVGRQGGTVIRSRVGSVGTEG